MLYRCLVALVLSGVWNCLPQHSERAGRSVSGRSMVVAFSGGDYTGTSKVVLKVSEYQINCSFNNITFK